MIQVHAMGMVLLLQAYMGMIIGEERAEYCREHDNRLMTITSV